MVYIEQAFDLTECSIRDYKKARPIRWEFGIFAVAIGITLFVILTYQLASGGLRHSLQATYGIGYVLPAVGAVICAWAYRMLAPGATRLVIDDDGIRFGFRGGDEYAERWTDHGFRLKLVDYRGNPTAQRHGIECYVTFRSRPTSLLPQQAFEALMTRARENHLAISVKKPGGRWRGNLRDEIEIRPAKR